jgi:hypothetical protein
MAGSHRIAPPRAKHLALNKCKAQFSTFDRPLSELPVTRQWSLLATRTAKIVNSVLSVLNHKQVRIHRVQWSAILGKLHFHDILLTGFTRETSEEFVDVLVLKFTGAPIWNRSVVNDVFTVPHRPFRLKQRVVAAAIFQIDWSSNNAHHARNLHEWEWLLYLNHDVIP